MKKNKPVTAPFDSITADFTKEDWRTVESEKKYYHLVTSLREQRKKNGLTQKELADRSQLPRATIVKVESGKRNATLETLTNMAQALGKDLVISLR